MFNKLIICAALISMLVIGGVSVSASTTDGNEPTIELDAGVKPGNFFYGIDRAWEQIVLTFLGDEKETERLLKYAEERLAELNELDEENLDKYIDELYQAYGANIEKVNKKLAEKGAKGEVKAIVKEKLDRVASLDEAIESEKVEKVSVEIKVKVNNEQTKAYALSIVTELDQEQVETLKEQGFGYGEIIKLQAFSEVSGKTIEELMFLDIYLENEEGKKEIDFGKLALELGFVVEMDNGEVKPDLDQIKLQFKAYKEALVELNKEFKSKAKEEMEAQLDIIRKDLNEKVEAKLQIRFEEFSSKIDEIYNAKVTIINNVNDSVLSEGKKSELLIELDKVKSELLLEVTKKVESGALSPRDMGQLNAEIHVKFNEVFAKELESEVKKELEASFDEIANQIRPIFDAIITRFETKHKITLTEDQKHVIWLEIEAKMNDKWSKSAIMEDLDDEVNDLLDKLYEEKPKATVDINGIFDELLNDQLIKVRLKDEQYQAFKQQLISEKADIIAKVDKNKNAFQIRMALYQAIMLRLETYIEEQDYINPNAEAIFDKILNSPLFRISTRLNPNEFKDFKEQLIASKAEILANIDLSETNSKIELELTETFIELLEAYNK